MNELDDALRPLRAALREMTLRVAPKVAALDADGCTRLLREECERVLKELKLDERKSS